MSLPSRGLCGAVSDLCMAIVRRDFQAVKSILLAAPHLAGKKHDAGFRPLDAAIMTGDAQLVELMLQQPCLRLWESVSEVDGFKPSNRRLMQITEFCSDGQFDIIRKGHPLHYACMRGNADVLRLILSRAASFDVRDEKGWKPYRYCDGRTKEGRETLRIYMEGRREDLRIRALYMDEPLDHASYAMECGDVELVREMLVKDPKIMTMRHPTRGWILLHMAVMNNAVPFVRLLLEYDTKAVNMQDQWDETQKRITGYLDRLNEPFDYVQSCTALHHACIVGDLEVVKMLLNAGADWTIKEGKGRLAETLLRYSHGDEYVKEFRRLCEEAKRRRKELELVSPIVEVVTNPQCTPCPNGSVITLPDTELPDPLRSRKLEEILSEKIVGQLGAVHTTASAIRLREHGWVDPDRPLVLLFLGSSGVGKTEVAKQVALYMNKRAGVGDTGKDLTDLEEDCKFIRLDMSEYQLSYSVANMTGAPKGYIGYEDGGSFSSQLKKNPKAVVLLDEIEKAHPDVLTIFLQVFDDGRITDSREGVVYCKDAIFILTSNIGSDEIKGAAPHLRQLVGDLKDWPEEYHRGMNLFIQEIHPVLKRALKREEFLGRINQVVVFLPLSEDEIHPVIERELTTWKKRAQDKHRIQLSWSTEVVSNLARAYDVNFGVRSVVNGTRRVAVQQLAESQIRGDLKKGWLAHFSTNELGDVEIKYADPKDGLGRRNGCRYYAA